MERRYLKTLGTIVRTDTGPVGKVVDIIINTDTGKIVAFLLSRTKPKIISPIDVLDWGKYITIHDFEDIVDAEDIQQVTLVLTRGIPIYKNKVVTKDGISLGRVIDFGMHPKFFMLHSLVVAKSFLGIFIWDKRIIPANDIIEITKKVIVVKTHIKSAKVKKLKKLRVDMASTG